MLPEPKHPRYLDRYYWLIEYSRNHPPTGYLERHHIHPRSMGGSNDSSNIIALTARQHFLAHWLLWKAYRNRKTAFAFRMMCQAKRGYQERYSRISSRLYEAINSDVSHSDATKQKMSQSARGKPKSNEHRRNISIANRGIGKGRKQDPEWIAKRTAHRRGEVAPRVSCVLCHKEVDVRNLSRHHKHAAELSLEGVDRRQVR